MWRSMLWETLTPQVWCNGSREYTCGLFQVFVQSVLKECIVTLSSVKYNRILSSFSYVFSSGWSLMPCSCIFDQDINWMFSSEAVGMILSSSLSVCSGILWWGQYGRVHRFRDGGVLHEFNFWRGETQKVWMHHKTLHVWSVSGQFGVWCKFVNAHTQKEEAWQR